MYTNNCARIKVEGKLTKTVPVKKGIRQGDSLSPLLFNIIINEIIEDIKTLKVYSIGDEHISCICYADEAALVAEDENSLQHTFSTTSVAQHRGLD